MIESVQLAKFQFNSNSRLHIFQTFAHFDDVESDMVCAVLCSHDDYHNEINSWIYNKEERICRCTVVEDGLCETDITLESIPTEHLFVEQVKVKIDDQCFGKEGNAINVH